MEYFSTVRSKVSYVLKSIKEIETHGKHFKGGLLTKADILWCMLRYKASPRNYYWFGFYEIPHKNRKTFVTHAMSEKIQRKNNSVEGSSIFINKADFYECFSAYMKRKCVLSKRCDANTLAEMSNKLIYKPLSGSMGRGIEIFENKGGDIENLSEQIKALPDGIVEEWIIQHEELNAFNASAVNIVRIVTGRKEDSFYLLAATLAVANGTEYTNATANSLFANIDTDSGEVISDACDYEENVYSEHPVTKIKFKGFKIPYWNETVEMLSEASKKVAGVGYVGWDIAITPTGPVIIEGNNDPGYEWMQVRLINPSGIGKKSVYSKLL